MQKLAKKFSPFSAAVTHTKITNPDLLALITKEFPRGWSNWSQLKPIFNRLQMGYCAYCEKEIGGDISRNDLAEQDIEHYRPKNEVKAWPGKPQGVGLKDGPSSGYPWLEKDPLNYCSSCKTCNSNRKACFFPVFQTPAVDLHGKPGAVLQGLEQPALIFPFGNLEQKLAEEFITFMGPKARPRGNLNKRDTLRAEITIEILGLNLDYLVSRRSAALLRFAIQCSHYWQIKEPPTRILEEPHLSFRGCLRAFLSLTNDDPVLALGELLKECGPTASQRRVLEHNWPRP